MQTRDVVVIGASAGGVRALEVVMRGLPADLPAAVLVVQHSARDSPGILARRLDGVGSLRVEMAADGVLLERGLALVAPPDRHMLVVEGRVRVVFGARENRARPAIDPLFRSAAVHCRERVIGVVMTGLLGDGAAGLRAVAACGGYAAVQSPEDAEFGAMPRNALMAVPGAHAVALEELAPLLGRLTRGAAGEAVEAPESLRLEVRLMERAMAPNDWSGLPARSTDFTCPACHGALREVEGEGVARYRCRVGHAFSLEALHAAKDENVEEALWVALQTLQERAQVLETMARSERERGRERSAAEIGERARETREQAESLQSFVRRLAG